jgi:hypothetical protein
MADARSWVVVAVVAIQGCKSHDDRAPVVRSAGSAVSALPVAGEPRTPDAIVRAVTAYRAKIAAGTPPAPGEPSFLAPPMETDLAWISDRSTPFAQRMDAAMQLTEDSKAIMRIYAEADQGLRDGSGTLRWNESVIRQLARVTAVLVDEFLPTLSKDDPTYQVRLGGLTKMGEGSMEMLRGALITLRAQRSDLVDRQRVAAAWSDHIGTYVTLWARAQCDQLVTSVQEAAAADRDPAIVASLRTVQAKLASCQP